LYKQFFILGEDIDSYTIFGELWGVELDPFNTNEKWK
jgi:hypothetical protein